MNFVWFIGYMAVVSGKYNVTSSPSLPTMNGSSSTMNAYSSTMNGSSSTMNADSSTMYGYSSIVYSAYPSTMNSFLSSSSPSTTTMNESVKFKTTSVSAVNVVTSSSGMHTGFRTKHSQPSVVTTRRTSMMTVTTKSCSYPFGLTQALSNTLLYAALSLAGMCIILLIIVCCCCNYKIKKLRRQLEQNATKNVNSQVNHIGRDIVSFPSPMQLETFGRCNTDGPPEQQEEPKYITVVNGNDNDMEQQYSTVTRDGLTNNIEGNETREPDSPLYSNASAFPFVDSSDTYEQLMSRDRDEVGHYTSLTRKKENNEADV